MAYSDKVYFKRTESKDTESRSRQHERASMSTRTPPPYNSHMSVPLRQIWCEGALFFAVLLFIMVAVSRVLEYYVLHAFSETTDASLHFPNPGSYRLGRGVVTAGPTRPWRRKVTDVGSEEEQVKCAPLTRRCNSTDIGSAEVQHKCALRHQPLLLESTRLSAFDTSNSSLASISEEDASELNETAFQCLPDSESEAGLLNFQLNYFLCKSQSLSLSIDLSAHQIQLSRL